MFHVNIRKDLHVTPQQRAVAQSLMGGALYDRLIGEPSARVDVDADELRSCSRCDRESPLGVISQNIDPERKIHMPPDFLRKRCHESYRVRGNAPRVERNVTKVLEQQTVYAGGQR